MIVYQNPDADYAADIKRQLKENNGYCPCAVEKSKDTKCKCLAFREQIKRGEPGACHCGLWIAEAEDERDG